MFDSFLGFVERISIRPLHDRAKMVSSVVMFESSIGIKSSFMGVRTVLSDIMYPIRHEKKMKGVASVSSVSIIFRLGFLRSFLYFMLTSMVPLNHLRCCLKNPINVAGFSCQVITSGAYFIFCLLCVRRAASSVSSDNAFLSHPPICSRIVFLTK